MLAGTSDEDMAGDTQQILPINPVAPEPSYAQLNSVPVFFDSLDVGHGGTFAEPHGGAAARVAVDWLEWQLRQDAAAGITFLGRGCRLCTDPKWTVKKKRIP